MAIDVAINIALALLVATAFGWCVVQLLLDWLAKISGATRELVAVVLQKPRPADEANTPDSDSYDPSVPPGVVGIFERLFAMMLVIYSVDNIPVILSAWMGAKLAANWQTLVQRGVDSGIQRVIRARMFIALMTGVVSLAIGAFAGLIARGDRAAMIAPFVH